MDPLSAAGAATAIIGAISAGLKLVDQFRDLVFRSKNETPPSPGATAERKDDAIQIVSRDGTVYDEVTSQQLRLDQWDQVRYDALLKAVKTNWVKYNAYFAELPGLETQARVLITMQMDQSKSELCRDFREMISIYQHALNISLPDHYQLYEVCQN